ncbi:hypothetical protein BHE74_00014183 [Ensete ventricosum]|nr:hypothetical protein BHE74_00014183 [Ensete ventricosum]
MHLIFSRLILSSSLCRLEQININSRYGVAKVVGTVASVGGATIITLIKRPPLLHHHHHHHHAKLFLGASSNTILNWTLGCVYVLGNCVAWSGWMVLQGLVASGISFSLQIWCIDRGGPLFVAVFQPAQTVVVAIMAAVILGDQLYTGGYDYINFIKHISQSQFSPHNAQSTKPFGHCLSFFFSRIIGSILIVFGLYFVLWGKSEEKKATEQVMEEDLRRHLLDQEKSHKQNAAVSDIP